MRVSIVAPTVDERVEGQRQFLVHRGWECRLYVDGEISPAAFGERGHVRDTALFLAHYRDDSYPLLKSVCHLRHGLVVLDVCAATAPEEAPVHYADLCLVSDPAQKGMLHERTGCAMERIGVVPNREKERAWAMILEQAIEGIPQPAGSGEMGDLPTIEELEEILLIRDPELDRVEILERVRQAISDRLAAGGYGPDVAHQGPEALRIPLLEEDATERAYAFLLRSQVALDQLAARSRLQEPGFQSSTPLVGRLIVAMRRFWNWMSTKWYVRGWMAQQAAFNIQAVEVISELLHVIEQNERRIQKLEFQQEFLLERGEGE